MTQPQYSPDGRWWWDGSQWVPAQPAYAYSPYAGYPAYGAPAPSTHDGKAIGSLVAALVGGCGLGSIAAVVLGHMSRSEARREGREPSGMALAGIIVGYVGIAVIAVLLAFLVAGATVSGVVDDGYEPYRVEIPSGPVAISLHSAEYAQEGFHDAHGRYSPSLAVLSEFGFRAEPGVTVEVVLAADDTYCMRAEDEGTTYYLSSEASDSVTTAPCG